jgi:hypothetical protein
LEVEVQDAESRWASDPALGLPSSSVSTRDLLRLQRSIGNQAVLRFLSTAALHVQRQQAPVVPAPTPQAPLAVQAPAPAAPAAQPQQAAHTVTTFTGTNFAGAAVQIDSQFAPALQRVDDYAGNRGVEVFVTHSLRQQGQALTGAVVTPVDNSNHLAGHAIDMNVRYGGTLYNSTALQPANLTNLPQPVQDFISDVRADPGLRWGGDFRRVDSLHIDDGLNENDAAYQQAVGALQAPATPPATQPAAQPAP